ncbi:hypothetical protein [Sphingomonas panaciterrae]|uniref:hypothetical protein n=1 Tax=Sphingomonas panaciterrae TaxID=1462999 RepID=UPI002FF40A99
MHKLVTAMGAVLAATVAASPVMAGKKPKLTWQVARTNDPITGVTSCVVAAWDRAGGMSFSRTGALYPFVENSSVHGLLVGVSSGGRYRMPTGDIAWRIDDHPFRTLVAADNPAGMNTSPIPSDHAATAALVEQQMRLVAAATATSTVASGKTARTMLDEMLAGSGLLFRPVAATLGYGLPGGANQRIGQITKDGLRPYPLDESLRAGLATCGIAATPGD